MVGAFAVSSCADGGAGNDVADHDLVAPVGAVLEESFEFRGTITLEELPGDSIGDVESFFETPDGDLLLGDRYSPRVRRYTADGAHLGATGSFGDGPFEFRSIMGVVEDERERVLVVGFAHPRVTILTSSLEPDTLLTLGVNPYGAIFPTPGGFVVGVLGYTIDEWTFAAFDGTGRPRWLLPSPLPERVREEPYWSSVSYPSAANSSSYLFVANAVTYPIQVFDLEGTFLHELGFPPPSFAPVTPVPIGAFPQGSLSPGFSDWVTSFTTIGLIAVVSDQFLVVAHQERIALDQGVFRYEHRSLDVYDILTRTKILEDVRLPADSRVIAGGTYLFVLHDASGLIPGQTISRWSVVTGD